jgi:Transglycosylase-like domain
VWKPLVSLLGAVVLAAPVTVALAAEGDTSTSQRIETSDVNKEKRALLLREAKRKLRAAREKALRRKRARAKAGRAGSAASPQLEAIAACESGGNPSAVGGGGQFRGKYQFTYSTWASVGGSGDPAAATEAEQDKRAAMLLARSGNSPWPVCG